MSSFSHIDELLERDGVSSGRILVLRGCRPYRHDRGTIGKVTRVDALLTRGRFALSHDAAGNQVHRAGQVHEGAAALVGVGDLAGSVGGKVCLIALSLSCAPGKGRKGGLFRGKGDGDRVI